MCRGEVICQTELTYQVMEVTKESGCLPALLQRGDEGKPEMLC